MVSFAVQKLLSLIRPHLYIFVFISITLRGESKRILLAVMYVQEYTGCVFLKEVYSFWAYIYLSLYSILSLFLCMVLGNVLVLLVYM